MRPNRGGPSLRGRLVGWLVSGLSLAKVATVVTSVTAILGLIFLLQPDWKPQPLQELSGKLTDLAVERHVTLHEYRGRFRASGDDGAGDGRQVGHIVHFTAEIKGFKGKTCQMQWVVYDATSKARLGDTYSGGINLSPEALSDRVSWAAWIPAGLGTVFVRLELYDQKNIRLTWADTEVFDATGSTGTGRLP